MQLYASSVLPVNSKGALLVLLWCTMMFIYKMCILGYVDNDSMLHTTSQLGEIISFAVYVGMLPAYLVIASVADICVGRYKIIVASIHSAFVGWITLCFILH